MKLQTPVISLARCLAPEDIRPGSYVGILHVVCQYIPTGIDGCDASGPVDTLWLPGDDHEPLKVLEVCLPFVLVRTWSGDIRTIDTRRHRIGQLDPGYARRVRRRLRDRQRSNRKRKR